MPKINTSTDIDPKSSVDNTKLWSPAMAKLIGKRILVGVIVTVGVTLLSTVALAAVNGELKTPDIDPES